MLKLFSKVDIFKWRSITGLWFSWGLFLFLLLQGRRAEIRIFARLNLFHVILALTVAQREFASRFFSGGGVTWDRAREQDGVGL